LKHFDSYSGKDETREIRIQLGKKNVMRAELLPEKAVFLPKEVLFRPHRSTLDKAMAEVKAFKSKADLVSFLNEDLAHYRMKVDESKLRIEPYGYDDRIGWDTYIISMDGFGVFGFTNGPLL